MTIIDEYTCECLAIDVAGSIRAGRMIKVLSRLADEREDRPYTIPER